MRSPILGNVVVVVSIHRDVCGNVVVVVSIHRDVCRVGRIAGSCDSRFIEGLNNVATPNLIVLEPKIVHPIN